MSYAVQIPVFKGPFDLLLDLILREEVSLYEVSISHIVDSYLDELDKMERCDLEVTTEFLMIASILIELKTRRLLPSRDETDLDAEFELWEHRDLLLARLIECKTFKDASKMLRSVAETSSLSFPRTTGPELQFLAIAPDPFASMTPEKLLKAYQRAIRPKPRAPELSLGHVTDVVASVSASIQEIARRVQAEGRLSFRQLTRGHRERVQIIVRFLAVLELYKQGLVELDQLESFGSIEVSWIGSDNESASLELVDAYDG